MITFQPTTFTSLLDIDTRAANFSIWNGLYNRFDEGLLCRENLADTAMATMEHVGVLESHIAALRMVIISSLRRVIFLLFSANSRAKNELG